MKELETEQLSDLVIYFPDILDGSTMIGDIAGSHSYHKDVIDTEDEDLNYKVKIFIGINKVIELANVFKCVYLDKHEFSFIVKELFGHYPFVCLKLLKEGKISFVDNDKFFMLYDLRNAKSFIQIHRVPKASNEKIIEDLEPILNKPMREALNFSFAKSISHKEPDFDFITNKFFDDLKQGYYQALAVGINSIIGVDNENKQLFDLIAQSTINMHICDLLGIESIYLKEYFYCTEKYKNQFKNSISIKRTRFGKISINDFTSVLASPENCGMSNEQLALEAHKNSKQFDYIGYLDEYVFLKYSFSCDIKRDYAGKKIIFVKKDGKNVQLPLLSFEDYLKHLQSNGQALRQSKLFIKITPKQYLDSFLNGDLKFSKPIEFTYEDKNEGQKDITEAAFMSEHKNGKQVCTRNVYDLEYTRIWCCFSLDNYMFTDSIRDGKLVKKASVKKEYYAGFIDEKNQNVIIFIKPDDFVNRAFSALVNKGVAPEDILICPITYIRKSDDFTLSCEPPYELFYKDIAYLSQNEVRILIRNSGNKYDFLFNKQGVINIGSIRDICEVIDGMYDTNMDCYLISDSKMEFTLPNE